MLEPCDTVEGWDDQGFLCPPATGDLRLQPRKAFAARSKESLERLRLIGWTSSTSTILTSTGHQAPRQPAPCRRGLRATGRSARSAPASTSCDACLTWRQGTDVDVVMLAGRYTLLEQDALDDLLPLCVSVASPSSRPASYGDAPASPCGRPGVSGGRTHRGIGRGEERVEAILSSVGEGVVVIDLEGRIANVNAAYEDQSGYFEDESHSGQELWKFYRGE